MLEITDPEVFALSGEKYHPIIDYSGNPKHYVEGILFELTEQELLNADKYEVDDYKRV